MKKMPERWMNFVVLVALLATSLAVAAQEAVPAAEQSAASDAAVAGAPAAAAEEAPKLDSGDTAWMLTSTALVLMMTLPGLALFYGGLTRKKNVLSVCMQCIFIAGIVTLQWAVVGYSIAFGDNGSAWWGGLGHAFMKGVGIDDLSGTIPAQVFCVFQLTFAIITPALIVGGFAERMRFSALVVFILLWATFIYDPLCHWVWGPNGILGASGLGALDFAGGTVVHISSGLSALVCALYLGKRVGYGKENFAPHNMTLVFIGTCLLWVGWFGFNAGSAVASNKVAGSAFIATHFATAAAAVAWPLMEWIVKGKPSVLGACSGAVAGLVAITPASGFVNPMAAIVIGLVAGVVCWFACTTIKNKFKYDDSLDVFGVHGVGGTVGAILTGVFAAEAVGGTAGLLEGNAAQVGKQVVGVLATYALAIVGTFILLKIVDAIIGVRVSEEEERQGLDITQHGEEGYNL